jgi:hypothetical protein
MNASQPGTDQTRIPSPALLRQLGLACRSSVPRDFVAASDAVYQAYAGHIVGF